MDAFLTESQAIILTYVISGDDKDREAVLAWETEFINFMKEQTSDELLISFNCERALEVGIYRVTLISYLGSYGDFTH